MSTYLIPSTPCSIEFIEKKSRFIAHTRKVNNEQEFKLFLQQIKQQYPDARHHCYGFRIGPLQAARRGFSDDGEPNSTAGMPILNVIDHSDFSDIAIIVVRYFGGIKLGTGGLTRAYSRAAKLAIESQPSEAYEETQQVEINCAFNEENRIRHEVTSNKGKIMEVRYGEQVTMVIDINQSGRKALSDLGFKLSDL